MLRHLLRRQVGKSWWLMVISDSPGLAERLGLSDGGSGLGDVLCGSGNLCGVAVRTEAGFDLVGAGTESSRIVDRLGSKDG